MNINKKPLTRVSNAWIKATRMAFLLYLFAFVLFVWWGERELMCGCLVLIITILAYEFRLKTATDLLKDIADQGYDPGAVQ